MIDLTPFLRRDEDQHFDRKSMIRSARVAACNQPSPSHVKWGPERESATWVGTIQDD